MAETVSDDSHSNSNIMTKLNYYLVGGAVRDQLLGLEIKDRDWVVVGATPARMLELGYKQVGADFPVFLHPETSEEYALARTERKTGSGYQGFECNSDASVTLEEDLQRRDLTINAMALDPQGKLIDPYGGKNDLDARILRHVSPAFSEDPLRVLRLARFAARFAASGFHIATETKALCAQIRQSGELEHLTSERVWQETQTALAEASPEVYFEVLQEVGALEVLFPELHRLFGVPQPEQYHPEIDCGIHAIMSLQQACRLSSDTEIRFAALVHDLGKALTPPDNWPRHHGHELKGVKPIKALCKRLTAPKRYMELACLVSEFHTHIHRASELRPDTVLKVLKRCDAFRKPARFEQILLTSMADARGRTGFEDNDYPQAELFRAYLEAALKVNAKALVEQGLQAKALGDAIDLQRREEIEKIKEQRDR